MLSQTDEEEAGRRRQREEEEEGWCSSAIDAILGNTSVLHAHVASHCHERCPYLLEDRVEVP